MGACARFSDLLAAAAVLITAPLAGAQPDPGDLARIEVLQNTLAAVAEEVRPSVVAIRADRHLEPADCPGADPVPPDDEVHRRLLERTFPAVGSGVITHADGLILTNEHVIHDAEPDAIECVLTGGERYTVQGITTDPRSDLAVLRIDARGLKPVRLGDVSTVRQGHFAIVMGNPFGSASDGQGKPAMSFGVISALGQDLTRKLDPHRYYGNLLQTDARINPGNSGGPLLNIRGEVIGLITAISSRSGGSEGVGYAIAIDKRTRQIIAQLARGETVEYGYLGVGLKDATLEDRKRAGRADQGGAVIDTVQSGMPATDAHLQPGDVVVAFDGESVQSADQLARLVGAARIDITVNMMIWRGGKRLTVAVAPTRRQDAIKGVNIEMPLSWRGMTLENPTSKVRARFELPEATAGVVVTHVEAGGAAEQAGLRPGQVIRQIGGEPVKGVRRLREIAPDLTGPLTIIVDADPPAEMTLP